MPIHSGENTQIQDQPIYPVSFSPMKSSVNALLNPIPAFFTVLPFILFHELSLKDCPRRSRNNPAEIVMIERVWSNPFRVGMKKSTTAMEVNTVATTDNTPFATVFSITSERTSSAFSGIRSVSIRSPLNSSVSVIFSSPHSGLYKEASGRHFPVSHS